MVVEDELSIQTGLCDVLTFRGYSVRAAGDGKAALLACEAQPFDLVLLDIMLPELDGLTVCRTLRERGFQSPIVMLTAKGSEEDVLCGFEVGADDYVTKPFGIRELLARVQAHLRRSQRALTASFRAGPFDISPERGIAQSEEETIELSGKEIGILRLLTEEPGRIVSRRTLLREVWGMHNVEAVETRTVDVHIAKLRKKLGERGSVLLETVRGQGYRWCASTL